MWEGGEEEAAIERAAEVLRQGGVVAFPTETVYGLGANALDAAAVRRVFAAKGRPPDNPLIVHIAAVEELETVALEVPGAALELAERFWPGPLTLVLPRTPAVPDVTTGGLDTVAVRIPAHPVALALVRTAGCPIAAPSANRSGRPSPTRAEHVLEDLGGRIPMVLDGGPCPVGVESTVLDLTTAQPVLLRPGGLSIEDLEQVVGPVRVGGAGPDDVRRSPGTRYRHYAPRARLLPTPPGELAAVATRLLAEGRTVGIMACGSLHALGLQGLTGTTGPSLAFRPMPRDITGFAKDLFTAMRELDAAGCDVILAEAVEPRGLGLAVMDRLRRASAEQE